MVFQIRVERDSRCFEEGAEDVMPQPYRHYWMPVADMFYRLELWDPMGALA